MAERKKPSQLDLIKEYFVANPNRDIPTPEIVDWVTAEHLKRTGEVFRDPDRGIRSLSQQGFLIKIDKGLYRYDPEAVHARQLEDFTEAQKQQILERDGYRCVMCGAGEREGVELHIDHIRPKDQGGKAEIVNGQVLCAPHNFRKKTLGQTETYKKAMIRLYDLAKSTGDQHTQNFARDVLKIYYLYGINGHIEWEE